MHQGGHLHRAERSEFRHGLTMQHSGELPLLLWNAT